MTEKAVEQGNQKSVEETVKQTPPPAPAAGNDIGFDDDIVGRNTYLTYQPNEKDKFSKGKLMQVVFEAATRKKAPTSGYQLILRFQRKSEEGLYSHSHTVYDAEIDKAYNPAGYSVKSAQLLEILQYYTGKDEKAIKQEIAAMPVGNYPEGTRKSVLLLDKIYRYIQTANNGEPIYSQAKVHWLNLVYPNGGKYISDSLQFGKSPFLADIKHVDNDKNKPTVPPPFVPGRDKGYVMPVVTSAASNSAPAGANAGQMADDDDDF